MDQFKIVASDYDGPGLSGNGASNFAAARHFWPVHVDLGQCAAGGAEDIDHSPRLSFEEHRH